MKTKATRLQLALLVPLLFLFSACQSFYPMSYSARSSLVDYLYPKDKHHVEEAAIPHLRLPLRVGIAYVPEAQGGRPIFSELEMKSLTDNVAEKFRQLDFVKSIEVIPTAYLQRQGGFENLDQIKRMFNVDVIALVSYDQTTFVEEGLASLTYWTIVGAYIVPGEKNDTHTLIDAAVFDIDSRKMLFRAPGSSMTKSRGTSVGNSQQVHRDSVKGFNEAGQDLTSNLELAIEEFKVRVKEAPDEIQVSRRPGYVGAGSSDWFVLLMLGGLLCIAALRTKRHA